MGRAGVEAIEEERMKQRRDLIGVAESQRGFVEEGEEG